MQKPPLKPNTLANSMPDQSSYQAGYCKPPAAHQFTAGHSGNPKGRPRGAKNKLPYLSEERLKTIVIEEAYRSIKVNDGDKQVTVLMAQAIVRSLAVTAAKGNTRAQRLFAELLASSETSNKRAHDEWLETAIIYKRDWDNELKRRREHSITAPDPIPHPDDVIINFRTGEVSICGPMTKEELADLDLWLNRKNDNEAEIKVFADNLKNPEYTPYLKSVNKDIAHTKRILQIIDKALAIRASPPSIQRRLSQLNLTTPDYLLKLKALEEAEVAGAE